LNSTSRTATERNAVDAAPSRAVVDCWCEVRVSPVHGGSKVNGVILRGILLLTGFAAVIAQIVLMRELMVIFSGNEVSLGLILAAWLLWTAVGSSLLGRVAMRARDPRLLAAVLFALAASVLPATIAAARLSRVFLERAPGEALSPGSELGACLAVLAVFCSLSGCLFAVASRVWAAEAAAGAAQSTSAVYGLEAGGSALGGLLASTVLLRFLTSFEIAFIVATACLLAAAALGWRRRRWQIAMGLAALALGHLGFWNLAPRLERASEQALWRGFRVEGVENSIYGNLVVVSTEGSATIYENGLPSATVPDPATAEESVHWALLQHPAPKQVLLIGGGVNGSLAEILRHGGVEHVDYVELDPAIIGLAARYFPREWNPVAHDPRVAIHNVDGRLWLRRTRGPFDVIVVNLPEPQTAQLNRFYTVEFFREAAAKMARGGVLGIELRASENYISPELAAFLRCIRLSLGRVFPDVAVLPGETVHFFASPTPGALVRDARTLAGRLRVRNPGTKYVAPWAIPFRTMPDRVRDLEAAVQPRSGTPVNRDFAPIAYYFDTTLWAAQFSNTFRRAFDAAARVPFGMLAAAVALLLAAAILAVERAQPGGSRLRAIAGFSAASMGLTMMGIELLLLLGFQAVCGYVYQGLALLTAAFMAGMAAGAALSFDDEVPGGSPSARGEAVRDLTSLARIHALAAAVPLALFAVLVALNSVQAFVPPLLTQAVFPVLAAISGAAGGRAFAVASRLWFLDSRPRAGLGALYGADLAGACLGALALSTWVVPVFGFERTAILLTAACLGPAGAAFWLLRRMRAVSVE